MRLTALFPPPPTPTTLILAESICVKELQTPLSFRREKKVTPGAFLALNSIADEMDVEEVRAEGGLEIPIVASNDCSLILKSQMVCLFKPQRWWCVFRVLEF